MKTYRFIYKYKDWNRTTSKLVRAKNLKEAKELFEYELSDYNIELKEIKLVK